MKAEEVREHLASLIVGKPKEITLGPYDISKAVRNYFLVIAKLEGYVIRTKQSDDKVLVTLVKRTKPEVKEPVTGVNGYYRKNKTQDFGWPVATLTDVNELISRVERIDLTPKPRVGGDYKTPHRKELPDADS